MESWTRCEPGATGAGSSIADSGSSTIELEEVDMLVVVEDNDEDENCCPLSTRLRPLPVIY